MWIVYILQAKWHARISFNLIWGAIDAARFSAEAGNLQHLRSSQDGLVGAQCSYVG